MKKGRSIILGFALFSALMLLGLSTANAWTMHRQKGVTVWDKKKAYDGYVIYRASALGKTVLIDMNGIVVRIWDGGGQEMLPPEMANGEKGHVLVTLGGKVQERDWNNKVVWEYDAKKLKQHHDWQKLPSGNYLVLGRSNVPKDRLPAEFYGLGFEVKKTIKMSRPMFGDRITEVTPKGEIAWDWHGYDHLDLAKACNLWETWGDFTCIGRGDWTHFNAIHYATNPGYEGKILASNRHHNEAIMIDKKTGDVVWRWGENILGHQHDVQMIDAGLPGEGNVLIMDNGYHSKLGTGVSIVYEVDPKTNKVVWSYSGQTAIDGTFRSWHISGCQRLPNGNTLITEGEPGRIFEVTKEGEIAWEYVNPFYYFRKGRGITSSVFKARKVPATWLPKSLELTPEMATAASLMGQARSQFEAGSALVEQATQVLKYSK